MSESQQRILAGKPAKLSVLCKTLSFRLMTDPKDTTIRWKI